MQPAPRLDGSLEIGSGPARAWIAPGLGANVVRWSVGDWEVLASPPDLDAVAAKPTRFGVPVLFPFPNRLRGGRYIWRGRTHQWVPLDAQGNARHGFAKDVAWGVVERTEASATLRLDVGAHPDLLAMYPFPSTVELRVAIDADSLAFELSVTNRGEEDMPAGFGLHPYFALPFGEGGSRGECVVRTPTRGAWVLQDSLPTGEVVPASGKLDLHEGRALDGGTYDDLLTDVDGDTAAVTDPAAGRRVSIEAARADGFREWVVYAPPGRDVVAVEPYTCPTDALNLTDAGRDVGVVAVAPGATWRMRVVLRAEYERA